MVGTVAQADRTDLEGFEEPADLGMIVEEDAKLAADSAADGRQASSRSTLLVTP